MRRRSRRYHSALVGCNDTLARMRCDAELGEDCEDRFALVRASWHHVERCIAQVVASSRVGAGNQQQPRNLGTPLGDGYVQRRADRLGSDVRRRPVAEQELDERFITQNHAIKQWRVPEPVREVDVGAPLREAANAIDETLHSEKVQRRLPEVPARVQEGRMRCQEMSSPRLVIHDGIDEFTYNVGGQVSHVVCGLTP